ncbi:MAG: hypothetical protein ACXVW3_14060 [Nocardioidaceae bacterium]
MLDLVQLAQDADLLAAQARNRRCCDALRPCRPCRMLRLGVRARRLVIRDAGRPVRSPACTAVCIAPPIPAFAMIDRTHDPEADYLLAS